MKMKKIFLILLLVVTSSLTYAQTQVWNSDPAHSRLGFAIEHLTVSEVDGRFGDFTVKVTTDKNDYSTVQIELTAQTTSIDTGIGARDNHLRAADFFDVEKYPTLTFKSTSWEKVSDKKASLKGDLTLHGVTKPVELEVIYNGTVTNPMSKVETAGFKILGSIKRSDFGIGSNFPELVLSDLVQIRVNAEFSPVK